MAERFLSKRIDRRIAGAHTRDMTTTATQSITKVGLITVKGRARMAFRRDGQVFYFPHIRAAAKMATPEQAATWDEE